MFKLEIDRDTCTGCGNCVTVCPVNAITNAEICGGKGAPEEDHMGIASGLVTVYDDFCTGCGSCMKACAYQAIKVLTLEQEEGSRLQKVDEFIYGRKRDVYALVKSTGPMTLTKISESLNIPPKEASKLVYALKADGKLWENEKIDGKYTYFTEPAQKIAKEAKVEAAPKVSSEIANKIKEQLSTMMKSFNEVKVRFLIESEKLDRAKEELTRKEIE